MRIAARNAKSDAELDDEAAIDYVRSFVGVMASDWRRRQLNDILPKVMGAIDTARERGDVPDVREIMKLVWLEEGPKGLLE